MHHFDALPLTRHIIMNTGKLLAQLQFERDYLLREICLGNDSLKPRLEKVSNLINRILDNIISKWLDQPTKELNHI